MAGAYIGGFPCKAFSWLVGSNTSLLEDTRARPFFNVVHSLKMLRPPVVILENVMGFLREGVYNVAVQYLEGVGGYLMHPAVLDPSCMGWPCKRERVYIIMVREDMVSENCKTKSSFTGRLTELVKNLQCPCDHHFRDLLFPAGHSGSKDLPQMPTYHNVAFCFAGLCCYVSTELRTEHGLYLLARSAGTLPS